MTSTFPASLRQHPCELCEATDFEVLSRRDRRRKPLNTVVCRQCGLVSHEQIPTDEELHSYYRDSYRQDYNGEFSPSAYRVVREWRRGKQLLDSLHGFMSASDRLLEIGSGIGCTVKNFELAGYRSEGVEPGEGFCRYSQRKLLAEVTNCGLSDLAHEPQFDVVLLVHVLEHFNSPRQSLQHIHDLLRPGGMLYVEVPNFGLPHAQPKKLFHYAHIYNFTVHTLIMMGQACGFDVGAVLNSDSEKNLRVVFEKSDSSQYAVIQGSYETSCGAMRRYNTLTYHARPGYLFHRVSTLVRRYLERRAAAEQLEQILTLCEQHVPVIRAA